MGRGGGRGGHEVLSVPAGAMDAETNACRICAGNESDPREVERAVRGLRILARLGRRAERALAALDRGEEFLEPVAWLDQSRHHHIGAGLESLRIRAAHAMPRYREVSRSDIPGWGDFSLEFGELDEDVICGQTVQFFEVHLEATRLIFDGDTGEVSHRRVRRSRFGRSQIGSVRLKSNSSLTFDPYYNWDKVPEGKKGVFPIPRSGKGEKFEEAARRLSDVAAASLLSPPRPDRWRGHPYPQVMKDLRTEAPGWIYLGGFAHQWLWAICEWARSVRTVTEVMAT